MSRALIAAALLAAAAATPAAAQLRVDKRADLAQPVTLAPGQGAIVLGFRRPDEMSAGKSARVAFARYDLERRDVIFQPKGAKKAGDTKTYWVEARHGDKKASEEYVVMIVSEGDYVLFGAVAGPAPQVTNTFCLGAPVFSVKAGETVYFGDFTPYVNVKLVDGRKIMAMAYSSHPDAARAAVAGQKALAAGFTVAALKNEATYACAGQEMLAYAVPGAPAIEPASAAAAVEEAPSE